MSEPISRQRPLANDEFRVGREPATPTQADPLAELARLVGREDPFRDLFPRPAALPTQGHGRDDATAYDPAARLTPTRGPIGSSSLRDDLHEAQGFDASYPSLSDRPIEEPTDRSRRESLRFPALPTPNESFDEPVRLARSGAPEGAEPPPLNADLWAQGMPEPVSAEPLDYVPDDESRAMEGGRATKRTLAVLAAVLLLTGGGLGATFLMRGTAQGTSGSSAPPTIMAETGPTKIQPPDASNASTGGEGTTALLEQSASDNVNNAKVVNTQERPVDLAQLPKAAATAQPDDGRVGTSAAGTTFPEPRKVKTVLIRPDGSVVGEETKSVAAIPVAGLPTPLDMGVVMPSSADPSQAVPVATTPVAKPATPKSTVRAATTPKATEAAAKPPKPAAAVEVAAATAVTPTDSTSSTEGGFAVQIAAPPTEQEAKSVMARLQKKYSGELGGHQPSIRKADKGDKSVYRVRVGNLTQDDAKGLCSKLQASGGSCFVVRN